MEWNGNEWKYACMHACIYVSNNVMYYLNPPRVWFLNPLTTKSKPGGWNLTPLEGVRVYACMHVYLPLSLFSWAGLASLPSYKCALHTWLLLHSSTANVNISKTSAEARKGYSKRHAIIRKLQETRQTIVCVCVCWTSAPKSCKYNKNTC